MRHVTMQRLCNTSIKMASTAVSGSVSDTDVASINSKLPMHSKCDDTSPDLRLDSFYVYLAKQ